MSPLTEVYPLPPVRGQGEGKEVGGDLREAPGPAFGGFIGEGELREG
jgi:hypothetical protein